MYRRRQPIGVHGSRWSAFETRQRNGDVYMSLALGLMDLWTKMRRLQCSAAVPHKIGRRPFSSNAASSKDKFCFGRSSVRDQSSNAIRGRCPIKLPFCCWSALGESLFRNIQPHLLASISFLILSFHQSLSTLPHMRWFSR